MYIFHALLWFDTQTQTKHKKTIYILHNNTTGHDDAMI